MHQEIVSILHRCLNGLTLSETEKDTLEKWKSLSEHNQALYNEVMKSDKFRLEVKQIVGYDSKALWKKINAKLPGKKNKMIPLLDSRAFRYAAAAVLLILISIATYMITNPAHHQPATNTPQPLAVADVAPGVQKAILTLADGKTLVLDNVSNGTIARQGNTTILKEDGLLAYNSDNKKPQAGVFYNTITTPRAGFYPSLVLSDGSKVWLNALSSIRFPTAFNNKERVVEITGEAYFEIAKNPSRPFRVIVAPSPSEKSGAEVVEVLGTHFNINSYREEGAIKTTLLEGAVKITAKGRTSFLKPGQQAVLRYAQNDNEIKVIDDADIEETIAWKNGLFVFKKQDFSTIMRQVSRWYDVDIIFKDDVSGHFVANVPRNVPVSKLLKIFEMTEDVHFDIDNMNKKITVRR
jgi:ferric-dicitrate binding protein FerR (iron transport regulator)